MSDRRRFRIWKLVLIFVIFLAGWRLFFWHGAKVDEPHFVQHLVNIEHLKKTEKVPPEKDVELHEDRQRMDPHDQVESPINSDDDFHVHMHLDGSDFEVDMPGGFEIMQQVDGEWQTNPSICETTEKFPVSKLKTPTGNIQISLYSSDENDAVSAHIRESGSWQLDIVTTIHELFRKHPDWVFIDIGAHLGVYTLSIAKAGYDVIALEPLVPNIQRICHSLQLEEHKGIVRVVHNAVSDKTGSIAIRNDDGREFTEETIMLDELSVLFLLKSVIVRIDTGRYLGKVLKGAQQFFTHVKVRYLLVDLPKSMQNTEEGKDVIQFLTDLNMRPAMPTNPRMFLKTAGHIDWPTTILWVKM